MDGSGESGPVEGVKLTALVELVPYRIPADGTAIFVFVSLGEDKEKGLPYGNGAPALDAIELGCLEFVEARLLPVGGSSVRRGERGLFCHGFPHK
jgi:hypothetical protein